MVTPTIKLESSEGVIFPTEVRVAMVSETIKTMLDHFAVQNDENAIVPLHSVSTFTLGKILAWANHHKDDDDQSTEGEELKPRRPYAITPWDAIFLMVNSTTLLEIILAAKQLQIKGLLELTYNVVANMIRGKTPEEIRFIFNIPEDVSPSVDGELRWKDLFLWPMDF
uniref:CG11942 n=1 Tax=Drosophila melanogaster TaxID=7227 RepID=Q5IF81_DROME|nr:CG11942 [Drosophila melanogaster]AAW32028.1 CG11942 [Drosophila melanogaster]AAW32029.1 CG11942 [Drosophila melanogaster]AAW32030.1 CG11942 [Drosophila melanogaster]